MVCAHRQLVEFVGAVGFGVGKEAIVAVFAFMLLPQPEAVSSAQPVVALSKYFAAASVMEVVAPTANDSAVLSAFSASSAV